MYIVKCFSKQLHSEKYIRTGDMLIWAAKVDFIESLKCRNGGHTSHFGTYCRSLWCLTKTTGVWRQVTEQDVIVKPMFWYTVSAQVQSTYVLTYCASTSTVNLCSDILHQYKYSQPMFWHTAPVQVQSTYVLTYCVSTSTVNLCSDILCQHKYSQPMFWHTVPGQVQSIYVLTYCVTISTVIPGHPSPVRPTPPFHNSRTITAQQFRIVCVCKNLF